MTLQDINATLALPETSRVDQRVPKKLLIENGAFTTSDKRQINDGIEEIQWLAALKPNTIGVPEYRDDVREYLEIAILSVTLRGSVKTGRMAEILHRAIPYPMLLLLNAEHALELSVVHKRWAQNEADKVVLDGEMVEVAIPADGSLSPVEAAFVAALALGRQPQATLYALYQGWMNTFEAFLAARMSGTFSQAATPEQAAARRAALCRCTELDAQIAMLQRAVSKETQIARQVAVNLKIKELRAERAQAAASL